MDSTALEQFKKELPRVYSLVLARAVRIVRAKRWGDDATLPEGQEARDLVHEAVGKVLHGDRHWDPVAVPDLDVFLVGVVRSLAYHLVTGGSSREVEVEQVEQLLDCDGKPSFASSPEELALETERCEEVMNEAFAAAGDEPILQKIVDAIMAGYVKADEIAQASGLTPEEVYEGNRKLRRRLKAMVKKKRSRP